MFLTTIPINAALEISPHGKGSTALYVYTHTSYVHTNRLIIEPVYTRVSIPVDVAFVTALKRDFEETRYV